MKAAGGLGEWEPVDPATFIPRADRHRRFHESLQQLAERVGWFPGDAP